MPNLIRKPGQLTWRPDASANDAPPGTLLRADNLESLEPESTRLRRGLEVIYSGLVGNGGVSAIFTVTVAGVRYRMAAVGDKVYVNGEDLGQLFEGSGEISFCTWLGHVFMARGRTRLKFDGTLTTNWGIPKPPGRFVAEPGIQVSAFFSTCNQNETPAWAATEGSITGTYPDGSNGTANGSVEVTPSAAGRATITRTFTSPGDYQEIEGYEGTDTDIIDIEHWLDKPEEVESITIIFGCSKIESADPFKDDYFTHTFRIGGSRTVAPRDPTPVFSAQSTAAAIRKAFADQTAPPPDVTGGPHNTDFDHILPDDSQFPHDPIVIDPDPRENDPKVDSSYNPGWSHLLVSRGSIARVGNASDRGWNNIRAIKVVYNTVANSSGKARFDNFKILGGGDRSLIGNFGFLFRQARSAIRPGIPFEYTEKSPPSDPTDNVLFDQQLAKLTLRAELVKGLDPQTNRLDIFMLGGFLDNWYLVGSSGASVNDTSMAIDEFARSPDGNISAFDRVRLNQFGLSVPGSIATFAPSSVAGMTAWLDADYIVDVASGAPVQYWPGRDPGYGTFIPTAIGSLRAWYKADSSVYSDAGVTPAVLGDTVRQWNDVSGNGFHLAQATGSLKPIYRTGIVNGRPALRFDGIDDFMSSVAISSLLNAAAGTVYVVFSPATVTGSNNSSPVSNQNLVSSSDGGYFGMSMHATAGLEAYLFSDAAVAFQKSQKAGLLTNAWQMGVWQQGSNFALSSFAQNIQAGLADTSWWSNTPASVNTGIGILTGLFRVGGAVNAGTYMQGDIAEVLVFNTALSPKQALQVERYLADKYQVPYSYDSTSQSIVARQGATAKRPTLITSRRNGKSAVYFDGTDDVMEISGLVSELLTNSAKTIFVVAEVDALVGSPAGAGSVDNNTIIQAGSGNIGIDVYAGNAQNYNDDGGADFTAARAYSLDAPYIFTLMHSGGTFYQGLNDTRTASMNSVASGNTATLTRPLTIGGAAAGQTNRFFKGYIYEVLVYNVAVTETERKQIESYLATKYAMTDDVPYPPTAAFSAIIVTTEDLIINLSASEINARVRNELLPTGLSRPPENIISMDAPYADRLWALTAEGILRFSERREPGMFKFSSGYRVAGATDTPYWVRRTGLGVFAGTAKDITWVSGTGDEQASGVADFNRVNLNVADPPINNSVCTDGNRLMYIAARGPMVLDDTNIEPLPLTGLELLWQDEDRHGISAINRAGKFRLAMSQGCLYMAAPEGDDDESTPIIYKFLNDKGWRRFTYPHNLTALFREDDGSLLAGTDDGDLLQLETGITDDGDDIEFVLWTPYEDGGLPLNRKDVFDLTLRGDTGGDTISIAVHKDGSAVASQTLSVNLNGIKSYLDDLAATGVIRSLQLRMSGSASRMILNDFNAAYRVRPQHRVFVDTGYMRNSGEAITWYRVARLCMQADADVTVDFYFDDVLHSSKDITVTVGKVTVYTVPLGREYSGHQPRVVIRKKGGLSTTDDAGFELQWIEFRQSRSGNVTEKPLRKVYLENSRVQPTEENERGD